MVRGGCRTGDEWIEEYNRLKEIGVSDSELNEFLKCHPTYCATEISCTIVWENIPLNS